jgi:hypothetical protein
MTRLKIQASVWKVQWIRIDNSNDALTMPQNVKEKVLLSIMDCNCIFDFCFLQMPMPAESAGCGDSPGWRAYDPWALRNPLPSLFSTLIYCQVFFTSTTSILLLLLLLHVQI